MPVPPAVDDLTVRQNDTFRDALSKLQSSARGILLLVDDDGRLLRTVTDGDVRRHLLAGAVLSDPLAQTEPATPVVAREPCLPAQALAMMDRHQIDHLPVLDSDGRVVELLLRKELAKPILLSTPHIGDAELEFVAEAFRTNWIAPLGPNVDAFERELAATVGVSHAAAVSSGTAAIHLGLRLLDVGPGDEVFCSTLTFVASANPILYQGGTPVFIDSEAQSWNMSPAALERALADRRARGRLPKAVVVVNLYGQSADMDLIVALCDAYGVALVEDAAESLGASYRGRPSGSFGRIGIFSFNGNKIITTSGGGMLVSDDEELVRRARHLSTQAREPAAHYEHTEVGYNYRMSNVLAGIGRGQLRVLDDRVAARRAIFEHYRERLADVDRLEWMPEPDWSFSNRWLTAATVRDADARAVIAALSDRQIEARPVWKPMHLQPLFRHADIFGDGGNLDVAADLFARGICLPSGSNMTMDDVDRVADALVAALAA